MIETIKITCAYCGTIVEKDAREVKRQQKKGRVRFYCNLSCAAKHKNEAKKKPEVVKLCPICGKEFVTSTRNKKNKTFCSRSCASKGSVTEYRRSRAIEIGKRLSEKYTADIRTVKRMMEKREKDKYSEIEAFLQNSGIKYEFEFILENKLYDLALIDERILVEFDGKDHGCSKGECFENDKLKDNIASKNNWTLKRIKVESGETIPHETVKNLVKHAQ